MKLLLVERVGNGRLVMGALAYSRLRPLFRWPRRVAAVVRTALIELSAICGVLNLVITSTFCLFFILVLMINSII